MWLDEAWVANSVLSPHPAGMFYYAGWVQTTPPLFLLLTRAALAVAGISNTAFRAVPLALALAAVVFMLAAAVRVASLPVAALATALMLSNPVAIEYSRTCKQYSGEMAASAAILLASILYLRKPGAQMLRWLVGACVLALPLAWSAAFLVPGAVIAVWIRGGRRHAAILACCGAGITAVLYLVLIRPNFDPQLHQFWMASSQPPSAGILLALLFCLGAAARGLFLKDRPRALIQCVALLPCFLFLIADTLRWYPNSPRTRLFLLPCFLLAAAIVAEDLIRRHWRHAWAVAAFVVAGVILQAAINQIREHRNQPEEDYQGAIHYIQSNFKPGDILLVHRSAREGFRLYWSGGPALFGSTGAPCCDRSSDRAIPTQASQGDAVIQDLRHLVPSGYTGRLWMLYSTRDSHWHYIGIDEGKLWRNYVWEMGCPPGPYAAFANLAVGAMNCVNARHAAVRGPR